MKGRSVVVAQALAFMCTCLLFAATAEVTHPSVELLRVRHLITVRQRITAGADPVVIPTCGTTEDRVLVLCVFGVEIEVKSAQSWVKAPLDPASPIPGDYPVEQQQATVVPAGTTAEFMFTFPKTAYILSPNQRLRLRISTWPTEESMRTRGPKRDLVTSPFTIE
jgi:hypothetical protein